MPVSSIDDVDIGAIITFRSKRADDTVVWRGTLESVGSYRSIRSHMDPASYNEAVRQTDPLVSSDVTTLKYFLITVDNSATNPTTLVFAEEWIEAGSLNVLTLGTKIKILVDDPNNNPQTILSLLANQGYACKIIS